MRHKWKCQRQRQQWLVAIVGALLLGAFSTAWGETCPSQKLVHVRPSDIGVTHVQMLGTIEHIETGMPENAVVHAFAKVAKMESGSTHFYGIGWIEGMEVGLSREFMPEHLPYLHSTPSFELYAIDSSGNDMEGPIHINVTHGSTLDTRRMGFRMEAHFESTHTLFQLRCPGWDRRYALHTANYPAPGSILPWYDFPHPAIRDEWTPQYELMQHAVEEPGHPVSFEGIVDLYNQQHRRTPRQTRRHLLAQEQTNATTATAAAAAQSNETRVEITRTASTSQSVSTKTATTTITTTLTDSKKTDVKSIQSQTAGSKAGDRLQQQPVDVQTVAATAAADPNTRQAAEAETEGIQTTEGVKVPGKVDVKARREREEHELAQPPPPIYASMGPAARPNTAVVPPQKVPLVVVMTLAFSPSTNPVTYVHYAQQLIRHVEYHLGTLRMQRTLVYIHEALYFTPEFHDFVARYMPAEFTPYVTFVVWNEFFMINNPWYDQYVKYFHGVVALWGYGGVLAALIDIDEYIAFAAPQTSLQSALERCQASHADWIRITNQMIICDTCHKAYGSRFRKGGGDVDLQLWFEAQNETLLTNNEGDGPCKLWASDPLKRYTNLWNDMWFATKGRVPRNRRGTLAAYAVFQSKHLIRPEAAVAFMHHRAELLPNKTEVWLDPSAPANCPYLAHLVHMNGFRPHRWGAKLEYFNRPARRANWFLLPQPPLGKQGAARRGQQRAEAPPSPSRVQPAKGTAPKVVVMPAKTAAASQAAPAAATAASKATRRQLR